MTKNSSSSVSWHSRKVQHEERKVIYLRKGYKHTPTTILNWRIYALFVINFLFPLIYCLWSAKCPAIIVSRLLTPMSWCSLGSLRPRLSPITLNSLHHINSERRGNSTVRVQLWIVSEQKSCPALPGSPVWPCDPSASAVDPDYHTVGAIEINASFILVVNYFWI